ncbi:MAG TPA: cytochrome c oxidase assembly protein [Gaiellaceae bacterium]|jgi:putative membrane protein
MTGAMASASPVATWTFDAPTLALLAFAAVAYARRARTLQRRGVAVGVRRPVMFALALATLFVAFCSPIDVIGEQSLFSVHMLQHLLIGDVAPLLVVLGLSGPLLRPVLALPGVWRLHALARPQVLLVLWAANLYLWHVPLLYDAALAHDGIHALEHALFFTCGALLWATLLELLPGPRWYGSGAKLLSLAFVWVAGGVLSNVFLWSGRAFYDPYRDAPRLWGLDPVADQRLGGGLMLLEMSVVVIAVAIVLGVRWLAESERRQQLLELGWEPARADRAVRYGGRLES